MGIDELSRQLALLDPTAEAHLNIIDQMFQTEESDGLRQLTGVYSESLIHIILKAMEEKDLLTLRAILGGLQTHILHRSGIDQLSPHQALTVRLDVLSRFLGTILRAQISSAPINTDDLSSMPPQLLAARAAEACLRDMSFRDDLPHDERTINKRGVVYMKEHIVGLRLANSFLYDEARYEPEMKVGELIKFWQR